MSELVIAAIQEVTKAGYCVRIRAGDLPNVVPQTIDVQVYRRDRKNKRESRGCLDLAETSARRHRVLAEIILECLQEVIDRDEKSRTPDRGSLAGDPPPTTQP